MSSWDAFKSERQSMYFDQISDVTNKDAPYGNGYSLPISYKIVGGKRVVVLENHARQDDFNTARLQPLESIAPKVTDMDPRQFADEPYAAVQDYFRPDGPRHDHPPPPDHPKGPSHRQDYPPNDYTIYDNTNNDYHGNNYPTHDYHRNDYPKNDYPKNDYPKNNHPNKDQPHAGPPGHNDFEDYATQDWYKPDRQVSKPDLEWFYDQYGDTPTMMVNRRPDSKDLQRNSYAALPPILKNRCRNDMSTVFEFEPGTTQYIATETEYKKHFDPEQETNTMSRNAQPSFNPSPAQTEDISKEEEANLFMLLPESYYLPLEPIKLTQGQVNTLNKFILIEIGDLDPTVLRSVFLDCSLVGRFSRNNYCDFQHLQKVLDRNKVLLRERTLRFIAAQFVDPENRGQINYEEFIKFVGRAIDSGRSDNNKSSSSRTYSDTTTLDSSRPTARVPTRSPSRAGGKKYYNGENEQYKFGPMYKQRQVAKLLKNVQDQLSDRNYDIDLNKLRGQLQMYDREHRGTLSGSQIKTACYQMNVPLQDSLLNSLLELNESTNRDGQYRWESFIDLLGRAKPQATGLSIPPPPQRREPSPSRSPRRDLDRPRESPRREQRREVSPRRDQGYQSRRESPDLRLNNMRQNASRERSSPRFDEKRKPVYDDPRRFSPSRKDGWHHESDCDRDRDYERDRDRPSYRDEPRKLSPVWRDIRDMYRARTQKTKCTADRTRGHSPQRRHDRSPQRDYQQGRPYSYRDPPREKSPDSRDKPRPYSYRDEPRVRPSIRVRSPLGFRRGDLPYITRPHDHDRHRDMGRDDNPRDVESKINKLTYQMRDLEEKNAVAKEGLYSGNMPWLDRYLKMANAMYTCDKGHKGCLPRKDVVEIWNLYNKAFALNLDEYKVNQLLYDPKVIDRSGNVLLHPFLLSLRS